MTSLFVVGQLFGLKLKMNHSKKKKIIKDKLFRNDFKDKQDKIQHILSCLYQRRDNILKYSPYKECSFFWLGRTWILGEKGFKTYETAH